MQPGAFDAVGDTLPPAGAIDAYGDRHTVPARARCPRPDETAPRRAECPRPHSTGWGLLTDPPPVRETLGVWPRFGRGCASESGGAQWPKQPLRRTQCPNWIQRTVPD